MSRWTKATLAASIASLTLLASQAGHAGYYDGKIVTMIVPNTPAGAMTQYARMLAPYISKHLGAKDVRVDNQPGAGSLRGTNMVWNAKPDGLTFAFTNLPTLIMAQLAGSPGVNFDAAKFTYLGSAADEARVLVVGAVSPIKSVEDIKKLNRPFVYPTQGTDEDFYTMSVLFNALGKPLKAVTGYQGDPDTSLAVIKGDGDGHMTSWVSTMPAVKGGEKRPIVHVGKTRHPDFPDVSAVGEILDEKNRAPMQTMVEIMAVTRGFFGPPNMDPQAVTEMRAAIGKAVNDPELVAEANKRGLPVHFYSGDSEQARIQKAMEGGKDLAPILKAAAQSIK